MEGSFVSLLNDGSFEDFLFSQPASQSQPPFQSEPQPQKEAAKSNKGKRSKNFLTEEDMLLISAWLNISVDPVQGNNQTHTCYWDMIWKYYDENKEGLQSDRTSNSLCNRWCTINEKVAKFVGFYNQVCSKNQSVTTEQNKIDETIETYETILKEKFMFIRHWHVLRFSPKFQATMDKKNKPGKDKEASSQSVDSQIHISL
ncbi:glutathione S-transferase T3-like [Apium graveolens]|uniref:glutathione S-transferase T3-like n=1 Tax=Apium graveolens TaxID=4045 RepID=UPI003D7922FD